MILLGTVDAEPSVVLQIPAQEPALSERELEKLYRVYMSGDFSDVVPKIARQFKLSPPGTFATGTLPAEWEESPWKGGLGYVLGAAWHYQTDYVERNEGRGVNLETLMRIVEDRGIGLGRNMALQYVSVRLNFGGGDPSMPPFGEVAARLGKIADDPTEDLELRTGLVPILFQHGDPNDWLDMAITFSTGETDAVQKGETFRRMAPSLHTGKLTAANRAKYLNHAFGLLEEMDDGYSGNGYFLADELSQAIVIPLGGTGSGLFRPAVDRPEFHDGYNLSKAFFQTPVDNARTWWRQHRKEYAVEAEAVAKATDGARPQKPRQWEVAKLKQGQSARSKLEDGRSVSWLPVIVLVAALILGRHFWRSRAAA